ncbi:MAG TPA: phosphatidylserine decarboxylase [Oceanipulchritudo sp.]|nr:phosphatidylserine decarboxylase [Oceanipulchritudo sp.]
MAADGIRIFNRYTGDYEDERVYGEVFLRLAYGTAVGRVSTWAFFSRPLFSRLFGWRMKQPGTAAKVRPFIDKYGLDAEEFAEPPERYRCFNDFFCRELKAGARPVDKRAETLVFPADGRHSGWQEIGLEAGVFVKGQRWELGPLLGNCVERPERFEGGTLVLSRLCPTDYHHFHFPVSGRLLNRSWLGHRLYSVSPFALRKNLGYLWANKRCLTRIEAGPVGEVLYIEVGATNVGSIRHHPVGEGEGIGKGDPAGWFEFGGSSLVTVFERGKVTLCDDLVERTREGVELYARMGDTMGTIVAGGRE